MSDCCLTPLKGYVFSYTIVSCIVDDVPCTLPLRQQYAWEIVDTLRYINLTSNQY